MSSSDRVVDTGKFLSAYASEVHVKCVRCNAAGTVLAQFQERRWSASFECAECGLTLDSVRGDWVGPMSMSGRLPCGYCGHKWLQPRISLRGWPREVLDSVVASCPECGHESIVPVVSQRIDDGAEHNDPHFGMPLLLVDAGRYGAVWAYNAHHIQALKSYVAASLRERGVNAGNASMFSRLPAWIKSAKNREAVSKRLARLERLLLNRSPAQTRAGGECHKLSV
ncbi:MAG: hypothetical protein EOO81_09055 [Oxalobacteraceae bacterium]|nr:MAG: hypothetical protein EOO81_09055 [Oxalobacteraceae bacterium]